MPVSFQQVRVQIKEKGPAAVARQKVLEERIEEALRLLHFHADNLDGLRSIVERARAANNQLRCAVPADERLTAVFSQCTECPPVVVLAADGSQVNPDRHSQVEFGVINTGAVRFAPGEAPREIVQTRLLMGEDLQLATGPMTEEYVALLRDLWERTLLAELAAKESLPVVALTDGQLELFRKPEATPDFDKRFTEYLEALRGLGAVEAVTAGYVDKPKGDLVVRLLELTIVDPSDFDKINRLRPLRWVPDAALFERLLGPGERSAVFKIQSDSSDKFPGELALHFFYINVSSDEGHPHLARVEAPAWVAEHDMLLDRLHYALVSQARVLGPRPYPYAIHRAHEVAVVRLEEKDQINDMIVRELRALGLPTGERSNKQVAKDNFGKRTRYP